MSEVRWPEVTAEDVEIVLAAAGAGREPMRAMALLISALGWVVARRCSSNAARQAVAEALPVVVQNAVLLHSNARGQG
jgi:hypothetical protein